MYWHILSILNIEMLQVYIFIPQEDVVADGSVTSHGINPIVLEHSGFCRRGVNCW